MKRTQWKDALRNIWKQKVSWLSIVVIAFLAVSAYVGIRFGGTALKNSAEAFYKETNFRDEEIISTLLLPEADLQAIRGTEGVTDAEGVYQTSGSITRGGVRESVSVLSLTERISLPRLISGRLPETSGECAVEQPLLTALDLSVGDTIEITDARGDTPDYLRVNRFVITGVVLHPDHMAWPSVVPNDSYVLVPGGDFDLEALDGCYMKALLKLERPAGLSRFDAGYTASLADTEERLRSLSEERAPQRTDDVQTQAQAQIDEGQAQLDEGEQELADARAELDEGWAQLDEGEKELAENETKPAEAKAELEDAWKQLEDAQKELSDAEALLAEIQKRLDAGAAELRNAEQRLASAKTELIDGWERLEDAKQTIRDMIRSGVEDAVGSEYADEIRWAARQDADLSGRGASAAEFWITDKARFDLSLSVEENLYKVLSDPRIPDEVLIEAYERIGGGEG